MLRNLAQSMVEHGRVTTTLPKAKTLRPFFEKLVTLAVKVRRFNGNGDTAGALRARRQIHKLLADRSIIPEDHVDTYVNMSDAHRRQALRSGSGRRYRTGEPKGRLAFTGESVTFRLIEKVAKNFEERPGGYTRIVRLPDRRVGDHTPLAMLQLVGDETSPGSLTRPAPSARQRRNKARFDMASKLAKSRGSKSRSPAKADSAEAAAEPETKEESGD